MEDLTRHGESARDEPVCFACYSHHRLCFSLFRSLSLHLSLSVSYSLASPLQSLYDLPSDKMASSTCSLSINQSIHPSIPSRPNMVYSENSSKRDSQRCRCIMTEAKTCLQMGTRLKKKGKLGRKKGLMKEDTLVTGRSDVNVPKRVKPVPFFWCLCVTCCTWLQWWQWVGPTCDRLTDQSFRARGGLVDGWRRICVAGVIFRWQLSLVVLVLHCRLKEFIIIIIIIKE